MSRGNAGRGGLRHAGRIRRRIPLIAVEECVCLFDISQPAFMLAFGNLKEVPR